MSFTLEDVYKAIADAESHVDPARFELDGVNVWLPTRDLFIRPFFEHREATYRQALGTFSHTDPFDWDRAPRQKLRLAPMVDVKTIDTGRAVLFNGHGRAYDSGSCDVLVHHAFTDYGEIIDGRIYNRVNDGLVDVLRADLHVEKLQLATASGVSLPYHHPSHFMVERGADLDPPVVEGEDGWRAAVEDVVAVARRQGVRIVHRPERLLSRLRSMFWRARLFADVLAVFRPRVVALQSYSRMDREAMILACWRAGIPTVDVEHGFMGPHSPCGALGFVADVGPLPLLPRWFWSWGESSRRFLEQSLGQAARWHTPVVGGSTSHRAVAQLGVVADATVTDGLARRIADAPRTILLCWQPDMLVHTHNELLPEHLLHAIRDHDERILFLVRLHPRSHHLLPRVARLLGEAGIDHEVEQSTRCSLSTLLPLIDVLATSYSTVAFEANELGTDVWVTDQMGMSMLGEYVQEGAMVDVSDRTRALRALRTSDRVVTRIPYIDHAPDLPRRAMERILAEGMPDHQ